MDNSSTKNLQSRTNINDRIQNFLVPNTIEPKNMSSSNHGLDNDYYNYKSEPHTKKNIVTHQSTDFKNDINYRLNMINDSSIQNRRRLPFNNNIRDSQNTTDSKRDSFNERISNYSLLSNNMIAPVENQLNNNSGFHSNFKEDNNERLQELSPLSRNMGFPLIKKEPNKKVMENIQTRAGFIDSYTNESGSNYQYLDNIHELNTEHIKPIDSRQKFSFKQTL
tara:strand:- start:38 stop:703 length:666 start_codon:yes stop_codon:yes gene_type:complete